MRSISSVLRILLPVVAVIPAAYPDIDLPPGIDVADACVGREAVAYSFQNAATADGPYFVQVGSNTYGPLRAAPSLNWSEDGRTIAFTVREGARILLYIDGELQDTLNLHLYWLAPTDGALYDQTGQVLPFPTGGRPEPWSL